MGGDERGLFESGLSGQCTIACRDLLEEQNGLVWRGGRGYAGNGLGCEEESRFVVFAVRKFPGKGFEFDTGCSEVPLAVEKFAELHSHGCFRVGVLIGSEKGACCGDGFFGVGGVAVVGKEDLQGGFAGGVRLSGNAAEFGLRAGVVELLVFPLRQSEACAGCDAGNGRLS